MKNVILEVDEVLKEHFQKDTALLNHMCIFIHVFLFPARTVSIKLGCNNGFELINRDRLAKTGTAVGQIVRDGCKLEVNEG